MPGCKTGLTESILINGRSAQSFSFFTESVLSVVDFSFAGSLHDDIPIIKSKSAGNSSNRCEHFMMEGKKLNGMTTGVVTRDNGDAIYLLFTKNISQSDGYTAAWLFCIAGLRSFKRSFMYLSVILVALSISSVPVS